MCSKEIKLHVLSAKIHVALGLTDQLSGRKAFWKHFDVTALQHGNPNVVASDRADQLPWKDVAVSGLWIWPVGMGSKKKGKTSGLKEFQKNKDGN